MEHPLQFSLVVLKEKGKVACDGKVEPDAFDSPLSGQAKLWGPVSVDLSAEWRDERVWLTGSAAGEWELECCRCLARPRSKFSAQIDSVIEEPTPTIDALEEVRQTLLLSVPSKPYCRPDCLGLCPSCGGNRNEKDCGCVIAPPSRFKIIKRGKTDA